MLREITIPIDLFVIKFFLSPFTIENIAFNDETVEEEMGLGGGKKSDSGPSYFAILSARFVRPIATP